MLTLLDKETTKQLELTTTPTSNLVSYYKNSYDFDLQLKVLSWYNYNGLTTKNPQKDFKKKLGELLGSKPLYHANYEYREAVWGFRFNELCNVILYCSEKGLSIQVDNTKVAGEAVPDLYKHLYQLLIGKTNA